MGKKSCSHWLTKIPDDILERTRVRKKKVAFKEEAEQVKSPGSGPQRKKMLEKKNCPGSVENGMEIRRAAAMTKIVCALYWRKRRRDTATGSCRRIPHQEHTTWISKCEEVKNLRKLRYQGNRSGNYHATRMSGRIWCQKTIERS